MENIICKDYVVTISVYFLSKASSETRGCQFILCKGLFRQTTSALYTRNFGTTTTAKHLKKSPKTPLRSHVWSQKKLLEIRWLHYYLYASIGHKSEKFLLSKKTCFWSYTFKYLQRWTPFFSNLSCFDSNKSGREKKTISVYDGCLASENEMVKNKQKGFYNWLQMVFLMAKKKLWKNH